MTKAGVVCGSIGAALSLIAIIIAMVTLMPMIYSAFEGCTALKEIIIPESALYFSHGVFRNCTSLTSAILPGIIFELEVEDTFEGCTSLTYFQG